MVTGKELENPQETKHNLEYGYLIVGLMQPSRKRTITTPREKYMNDIEERT
jgi:hypothetical protein